MAGASWYEYLNFEEQIALRTVAVEHEHIVYQYRVEPHIMETNVLTELEQRIAETVSKTFQYTSLQQIINLSHEEQAWQAHQANNEIIDYTHAFYLKHL